MFRFVERERAAFPVTTMCRVLGVSPSGYWAWSHRPPSARARADAVLSARISQIHLRSRGTYGAPRVQAELRFEDDLRVGRKRVARLMRAAQLEGVHRRRFVRTTVRDETKAPAPDLVRRSFNATAPDRLWVADITYLPTWQGFLVASGLSVGATKIDVLLGAEGNPWAGRPDLACHDNGIVPAMKTTIDRAGRLVIPRRLRDQVGLAGGGDVELELDGSAIRVQPVGGSGLREDGDLLLIPASGSPLTAAAVRGLIDAGRHGR